MLTLCLGFSGFPTPSSQFRETEFSSSEFRQDSYQALCTSDPLDICPPASAACVLEAAAQSPPDMAAASGLPVRAHPVCARPCTTHQRRLARPRPLPLSPVSSSCLEAVTSSGPAIRWATTTPSVRPEAPFQAGPLGCPVEPSSHLYSWCSCRCIIILYI